MLVRVVRAVVGIGLLLVGLPPLLAGGALWFAMQHQDPAGGYSARLSTVHTEGYAVVASDVDALLRREAPFARGGQTTVRLTAHTAAGPAFVGLAPPAAVARYLAGVGYTRVDEVRLARGPLPVVTIPVNGVAEPAGPPVEQPFWQSSSPAGTLEWRPSELRDQRMALVVMHPQAQAPLTVDLTARVHPEWLDTTTLGLLVLGTVLLLGAILALAWPTRPREIVYVVPPAQVPEIAAQLGIPVPRTATDAPDLPDPAPTPDPPPPAPSASLPDPPPLPLAGSVVEPPLPLAAPEPHWSIPLPEPAPPAAPTPPAVPSPGVPPFAVPASAVLPSSAPPAALEWPPPTPNPTPTAQPAPPAVPAVPLDRHNCQETGVSSAR